MSLPYPELAALDLERKSAPELVAFVREKIGGHIIDGWHDGGHGASSPVEHRAAPVEEHRRAGSWSSSC